MVGNSHHTLLTQHTIYYLLPRVHGIGKLEINYMKRTVKNKKKKKEKKSKRNFRVWADWKSLFPPPRNNITIS